MKKIIIAIDSFKGCLTSAEAGKAAEKGIKSINPSCHTSVIPIADGGEGLLDVLITATKGKYITLSAHGPLMKMAKTHYGLSGNGRTAIIEMAAISGLPLVPMEQRNPDNNLWYRRIDKRRIKQRMQKFYNRYWRKRD